MTRTPFRRRTGEAVPRVENIGDLIPADHKLLSEGCESQNNDRCAVVVQDLARSKCACTAEAHESTRKAYGRDST